MTETADTGAVKRELEQHDEPQEARDVRSLLESLKPELVKSLGRDDVVTMLVRHYYTAIRFQPALLECSADSLAGALLLSAQLRLEPGPLGHVYLVPFKGQCQWILGYTGIVELARRSGIVGALEAILVWDNDHYSYRRDERGAHFTLEPGDVEKRKDRRLVVVTWKERAGNTWMPRVHQTLPARIERAQKASAAFKVKTGPWLTDTDKMWLKTGVRDCRSELPLTADAAYAWTSDDATVYGIDVDASGAAIPATAGGENDGE